MTAFVILALVLVCFFWLLNRAFPHVKCGFLGRQDGCSPYRGRGRGRY